MKSRVLFLIMIAIGLAAGLAYAWLISPVNFTASSPAQVITGYRQAWLIMAAEAYVQDGDWLRTQQRLNSLRDRDLTQTVVDLFDQYNVGGPNLTARALAQVADRLNARTAPMVVYLTTPVVTPTPIPTSAPHPTAVLTSTPTPEPTLPTLTPSPTLIPNYDLVSQESQCQPDDVTPQIQVIVQDAEGLGVPGKEVWITWDGGADRFVTGLKPEIDPGYGDFDMSPNQTYNVAIDRPTAIVASGLQASLCSAGRTSWRLIFKPAAP
jgi:hypothetical protein